MDQAIKVEHTFEECKDAGDDSKINESPKMAIICVGSTGTGKSSLITLFCNGQVTVGHGTNSGTKESSLVSAANDAYWLDSQGTNDSSGEDDEKVLTDILKKLYDQNISKIKVVWCVSGDMCREKPEFQIQAKFIKSLGNGVWNSCLIIKKMGLPQPEDMNGVLAAANHNGANISEHDNKHLFGYTGLQFGDHSKDRTLRLINKIKDDSERQKELLDCGYLTNTAIVTEVSAKLSKLSSIGIHFENLKCSKCGQKGDPRFIYAPCHTESEKHHPKSTVPYHKDGSLKSYHPSKLVKYHSGQLETKNEYEMYHPLEVHYVHTKDFVAKQSTSYYHSGSYSSGSYYHPSGTIRYKYILFSSWSWGRKHKCCGKEEGRRGCEYESAKYSCCNSTGSGCRSDTQYWDEFPCCNKKDPSEGCTLLYKCCSGPVGSTGCTQRTTKSWVEYTCCTSKKNSTGCKQKYTCCDALKDNKGCKKKWDCCDAVEDNKGCQHKHECCEKNMGEEGCEERCQACKNKWGEGPGCVKPSKKES